MLEEPTIFITKASGCFDATRKRESFFSNHLFKPQASLSSIRTQTISCWIHGPELNECKARFIDSMDPFAQDAELCLREFSKSSTDHAYTWYLTLNQDPSKNGCTYNCFQCKVHLYRSEGFSIQVGQTLTTPK